jgi:hypothetical protein
MHLQWCLFLLTFYELGEIDIMRTIKTTILLGLCTISSAALAQSLTLYSGTNFSGESRQVSLVNTNVGGFVARSADAQGKWRVCTGPFGLLGCRTIEGRMADLGGNGMAVVSAIFGVGTGTGQQNPQQPNQPGGQAYPPQSGIVLYSGPNYTGRQVALNTDISNLNSVSFGDDAQSAITAQGESWQLCEHSNYEGRCLQVSGAFPSLVPLASMASSARRGSGYPQQQTYPQQQNYPQQTYPAQQAYGAAAGRTASFFAAPLFNGQPMLACPDSPTRPSASCAKKSAEQFCRLSGFAKLAYSSYSNQGTLEDVLCTR